MEVHACLLLLVQLGPRVSSWSQFLTPWTQPGQSSPQADHGKPHDRVAPRVKVQLTQYCAAYVLASLLANCEYFFMGK